MVAGPPLPWMNRMMLLDLLDFYRVNAVTKASLQEVTDDGATVIDESLRVETIMADTVVIAVGLEPEQVVYRSLRGQIPNLYLIGDARSPWNIMSAIWDAYEVARAI